LKGCVIAVTVNYRGVERIKLKAKSIKLKACSSELYDK
jgi:hypothetical protein